MAQNRKARQLSVDAMLSAMCAVLGYLSLDMGNLKVTFESLPILLGALLFGPLDGFAVGAMGTLIYQVLRYGVTVTTLLWMLPYMLCGLAAGAYARRCAFSLTQRQTTRIVLGCELMVTALNTVVLYVDSLIYGYYSAVYVFGSLVPRVVICIGKGAAFAVLLPVLLRALHHAFSREAA